MAPARRTFGATMFSVPALTEVTLETVRSVTLSLNAACRTRAAP